jgi:hypothetical protein
MNIYFYFELFSFLGNFSIWARSGNDVLIFCKSDLNCTFNYVALLSTAPELSLYLVCVNICWKYGKTLEFPACMVGMMIH